MQRQHDELENYNHWRIANAMRQREETADFWRLLAIVLLVIDIGAMWTFVANGTFRDWEAARLVYLMD